MTLREGSRKRPPADAGGGGGGELRLARPVLESGGGITAPGAEGAGAPIIPAAAAAGANTAPAPLQGETGPSSSSGMSERAFHRLPGGAGAPAGDAGRNGARGGAAGRACSSGAGGRGGTMGAPQGPVRVPGRLRVRSPPPRAVRCRPATVTRTARRRRQSPEGWGGDVLERRRCRHPCHPRRRRRHLGPIGQEGSMGMGRRFRGTEAGRGASTGIPPSNAATEL